MICNILLQVVRLCFSYYLFQFPPKREPQVLVTWEIHASWTQASSALVTHSHWPSILSQGDIFMNSTGNLSLASFCNFYINKNHLTLLFLHLGGEIMRKVLSHLPCIIWNKAKVTYFKKIFWYEKIGAGHFSTHVIVMYEKIGAGHFSTHVIFGNKFSSQNSRTNPIGMKGHMAKCYGDLVQELWSGTQKNVAPLKLRVSRLK